MAHNEPSPETDPNWFWTRYWHSDRIASCGGAGQRNYRKDIVAGWQAFFSRAPDGAMVLDLCTGNGALAIIASETLSPNCRIHAIDQADIRPAEFLDATPALERIRFKGRTPANRTGLPRASCDVVCGQYALEYTDQQATIAEIARALKPAGALRFVIHAAEGNVVQNARRRISEARWVLEEEAYFNRARQALMAAFEAEATVSLAPEIYRHAADTQRLFRQSGSRLRRQTSDSPDPDMLQNVAGVIEHAFQHRHDVPWEAILRKFDSVEAEVRAYRARLEAMVEAAMGEAEVEVTARQMRSATGVALHVAPMRSASESLLGWELAGSSFDD
jgi:SAM-dependent methyltransferase